MRNKVQSWNWTKYLVTACTALLLTGLACVPSRGSAGVIHCSGSSWTISISGTELTLDGSRQCIGSLVVPDNITSLGASAFDGQSGLTSIYLPDSITSIGDNAFLGCSGLKSIRLPAGLQSLPINAFSGASALRSIALPKSLTSIGGSAFYHATALRSIVIPEGVTQLPDDLFNGASALNSVTLPSTLRVIGDNAFYGATSLTDITIPNGVTTIGQGAFSNNYALEYIYLPDSVTQLGADSFNRNLGLTTVRLSNQITSIPANAFYAANSLRNLRIPASVTSIGSSAFFGNNALESLTIPSTVTSIGSEAFKSSTSLHRIYLMDDSSLTYGAGAFDGLASEAQFFITSTSPSDDTMNMLTGANGGINFYQYTTGNRSLGFSGNGATSGDLPYVDNPMPGSTISFPENDGNLSKSGYAFAGWNTRADGKGTLYKAGKSYSAVTATQFYATWIKEAATVVDTSTFEFAKSSSKLTSSAKAALKKKSSSLKSAKSVTVIAGAGYLAHSTKLVTRNLALARAKEVKNYLVKLGVEKSRITTQVKIYAQGSAPKTRIVLRAILAD